MTTSLFAQFTPIRNAGWVTQDSFDSVQKTADGGIIASNTTFTKKITETGSIQFSLPYKAKFVIPLIDGGYILGVNNNQAVSAFAYVGGYDVTILKINASGATVWQKGLSGSADEYLESMKLSDNGDVIALISGNSTDGFGIDNKGGKDLWVVHITSGGTFSKINLGGSADEVFKNLEILSNNDYLVCLTTSSQNGVFNQGYKGGIDTWVVKINKSVSLSIASKRAYGGYSDDEANLIISNQKYLLTGYSKSNSLDLATNNGLKDIWVCFINQDGTLISSNNYGGSNDDFARQAYFNPIDNAFYILCDNNSLDGDFPNSSDRVLEDKLLKFSSTGTYLWRRDFYVKRSSTSPYVSACSMVAHLNESGVFIQGGISPLQLNPTDLFQSNSYSYYAVAAFFCKLSAFDGSTSWYKVPHYGTHDANMVIIEKLPNGNILCRTNYRNNSSASSSVFTIDSQGNEVRTLYESGCATSASFQCYAAAISRVYAIAGTNDVIFRQGGYGFSSVIKVCPIQYQGIVGQTKYVCSESMNELLIAPDNNEFTYQWKKDGMNIEGATSTRYNATSLGSYSLEISGRTCVGKATTEAIILSLVTTQVIAPRITALADTTICQGDSVCLSAVGGCNYSYLQWQKDGVDIVGESSLTFKAKTGGSYRLKITGNSYTYYSNVKVVTITCCNMTSVTNGDWDSTSTWSCGRIPNELDNVVINGHDISITTNTAKVNRVIYRGGRIKLINSSAQLFIKNTN